MGQTQAREADRELRAIERYIAPEEIDIAALRSLDFLVQQTLAQFEREPAQVQRFLRGLNADQLARFCRISPTFAALCGSEEGSDSWRARVQELGVQLDCARTLDAYNRRYGTDDRSWNALWQRLSKRTSGSFVPRESFAAVPKQRRDLFTVDREGAVYRINMSSSGLRVYTHATQATRESRRRPDTLTRQVLYLRDFKGLWIGVPGGSAVLVSLGLGAYLLIGDVIALIELPRDDVLVDFFSLLGRSKSGLAREQIAIGERRAYVALQTPRELAFRELDVDRAALSATFRKADDRRLAELAAFIADSQRNKRASSTLRVQVKQRPRQSSGFGSGRESAWNWRAELTRSCGGK